MSKLEFWIGITCSLLFMFALGFMMGTWAIIPK